jgi:hypothetical protein
LKFSHRKNDATGTERNFASNYGSRGAWGCKFEDYVRVEGEIDCDIHNGPVGQAEITSFLLNVAYDVPLSPNGTSASVRVRVRMRFGLGMNSGHTLEQVRQQFSVTRERIRQIEPTSFGLATTESDNGILCRTGRVVEADINLCGEPDRSDRARGLGRL